jgi:hypothetical protein
MVCRGSSAGRMMGPLKDSNAALMPRLSEGLHEGIQHLREGGTLYFFIIRKYPFQATDGFELSVRSCLLFSFKGRRY